MHPFRAGIPRTRIDRSLLSTAALFREQWEPLARAMTRLFGHRDLAEDAAQGAFYRLVRSPPGHAFPMPWLFCVARNVALERARCSTRRARLLVAYRAEVQMNGDGRRRGASWSATATCSAA